MSGFYDDTNRQIMPRWYPYTTACQLGDLMSDNTLNKPKIESYDAFTQKIKDWQKNRTITHAIDVVGTALILGDFLNKNCSRR